MAIIPWSFDAYTFPIADSPTGRGGADEWNYEEKLVIHSPINSTVDILTSYGFKSPRRTITGRCSKATRDALRAKFLLRTVGYLVDGEGTSKLARAEKFSFKEIFPLKRYEYDITFIARE